MCTNFRWIFSFVFVSSLVIYLTYGDSNDNGNDFRAFMDETQNPCTNFYGYACGNWQRTLKDTKGEFRDLEGYLKQQYIEQLAAGFEKRMQAQATETSNVYRKAQNYYKSCRKTLGLEVFQYVNALKTKYEDLNWLDILHNSNVTLNEQNWNWLKVLGRLHSYGFNNALMSMTVVRINATLGAIKFGRPESTDFDATEQLALEPLEPVLKSNILGFKQQLDAAGKEHGSVKSGFINLAGLAENFVPRNIRDYLDMLPKTLEYGSLRYEIEDVNYIRALQKLITETPQSVVAYFVGLKFVTYLRAQMPKRTEPVDCLSTIKAQEPKLLNFIYAEQFYGKEREESFKVIAEIFRRLKLVYLDMLSDRSVNLDDKALKFVQDKLLWMQLNIGELPHGGDVDYYENYSRDLEIETEGFGSFYHNHLNLMRFRVSKNLELLDITAYAPQHIFYTSRNGPSFDRYSNLITYPYSLLRKPIFALEEDQLFHYAGIGSIMAHDMAHAFDPVGLKYDTDGNPSDMFQKILNENSHFVEALKCIRKQPTSRINEKLADFVGSRVAYNAFFKKFNDYKEVYRAPQNMNMTRKQIFFVKFSQFYCVTDSPTTNEEPMKWLSQIVENNEEFFDVFQCKKPKNYETCNFW